MKQNAMFMDEDEESPKYTKKIDSPIYEPKHKKPHIMELYDNVKTKRLILDIKNSNLPDDEKQFLILSAYRHVVFNYEKIADYYAHASMDMQNFMEKHALIIIDFENAIKYGYVKLCDEIRRQYLNEYQQ